MIADKWNKLTGESFSQKVIDRVKPDVPLKTKMELAQQRLQFQISKLDGIHIKLKEKHDKIFGKIIEAQRNHSMSYAQAYAAELVQVRKMRDMVNGAKLSMEQVQMRLNTISELGDVVVTLSPCMSVIKGISSSLSGLMPEANASMQDLSQILGDVLSGASIGDNHLMSVSDNSNSEAMAILNEAHSIIEGETKTSLPEIPSTFTQNAKLVDESLS